MTSPTLPAVLVGLAIMAMPAAHAGPGFDKTTCTFAGKPLYGRVQIVDAFPDVKVQVVDAFADVHVKRVTAFPTECGRWQMVTAFPDVKVQLVTAFPDVRVRYVDAFPGAR